MINEIIRKLASVADSLDEKGYYDDSSLVDSFIEKIAKMADKDYDGDGKVETSSEEWKGSRDKAIKDSMKKTKAKPKAKKKTKSKK
jgi:hypothetical protein